MLSDLLFTQNKIMYKFEQKTEIKKTEIKIILLKLLLYFKPSQLSVSRTFERTIEVFELKSES